MPSVLDLPFALAVPLAFLLGAVPFAWLVVRLLKGIDVRTVGSGNVGATNASRAFTGKGRQLAAFLAIYLLDAGKGFFAVLLVHATDGPERVACGAAAILGHVFTPFLGFRGGKGVATATGALLALDWRVTAIALVVFFAVRFSTGQVFFGSLALGLALAGAAIGLEPAAAFGERLPLTCLCLLIAAFLFWTHRSNLQKFFVARRTPRA
ncbi:MAG: glycerol-3-phosphate acyltransferase [Planctomycetes bacterium]|nr:glycerol-3-phosphate acyltransferase [Planctomycetota bacterium]